MMNLGDHLFTLAREINVEVVDWDEGDKKTNLFEYIQEGTDGRNNMRLFTVFRGGDIHKEFENILIYYHAQDLIQELENVRKGVVDLKKAYRDALIHVSTLAPIVRAKVERKEHDVVTRTLHQDVLTLLCIKYELLKKPFNLITQEVDKVHDGWLELSRNALYWNLIFCRQRYQQRHGKKIPKDDRPASWALGVNDVGYINTTSLSEKNTHSLLKVARRNYKEFPETTTIVPLSVADFNGKKWSGIIISNVEFTSHNDKVAENQFDVGMWELFGEETRHYKGESRTFLIFNNERRRNDALMWLTRPVK
jgi:hypothetical protein